MMITHVVAAAENDTIGVDGGLPWDIPEDLQHFRNLTNGHALIMGRKTFESIGRPLPNRLNVIVTRQKDYQPEGALVAPSLEAAIELCSTQIQNYGNVIDIIGGGEIYKQSQHLVDRIYITRVHMEVIGDTKYPPIPKDLFELTDESHRDTPVAFTFQTYNKRKTDYSSR
ncbi:MAG: dihydrofolate reductase [Bdellovibrionales bacterium]|nr:dihydrofolate reductase [Bdellovibrionales bacterium]